MSCRHKDRCPFYEEECDEPIIYNPLWPYEESSSFDTYKWNVGVLGDYPDEAH